MQRSIWRPIAIATAISGALDILFAMILTLWFGRAIPDMLRGHRYEERQAAIKSGQK